MADRKTMTRQTLIGEKGIRPPSITETLTTNLLLVAEMPASLFVATSRFGGDYRAAGEALAERGMRASGWVLRDGMV